MYLTLVFFAYTYTASSCSSPSHNGRIHFNQLSPYRGLMELCKSDGKSHPSDDHCDWHWDGAVCWPRTPYNTTATLPCPSIQGYDTSKIVSKYCGSDGFWRENETEHGHNGHSQTNFVVCLSKELLKIVKQIQHLPQGGLELRMLVTRFITALELIGLTVSLILVLGCFVIYYYFRKIRNDRTKIHMHLLTAVFLSVMIKLIIIIDQLLTGANKNSEEKPNSGLHGVAVLCEFSYVLLEYSKSSVYMWMFVEALHLYHASAVTATPMNFRLTYLVIGWGVSASIVFSWSIAMAMTHHGHCWFGYNYNSLFWILEGPRIITLVINTYYLIRILAVIFIQVGRQVTNEMDQLRKTVRATIALLPLLGITHYLSYAEPPIDGPLWYFIFYCLISYFLTSFHGTFISLMYFLLTEEVKKVVLHSMKSISLDNTNENRDSRRSQKQNLDEDDVDKESAGHDAENPITLPT